MHKSGDDTDESKAYRVLTGGVVIFRKSSKNLTYDFSCI